MHRVFISYSSRDKAAADTVCAALERDGCRCWIAPRDVQAGEEWGAAIIRGIEQSEIFVLIFSSAADQSRHVRRELESAVRRELPVLPFRIENVAPTGSTEYFISSAHWIDAFDGRLEKHSEDLARTIGTIAAARAGGGPGPVAGEATGRAGDPVGSRPGRRRKRGWIWLLAAALLAAALAAASLYYFRARPSSPEARPTRQAGPAAAKAPAPRCEAIDWAMPPQASDRRRIDDCSALIDRGGTEERFRRAALYLRAGQDEAAAADLEAYLRSGIEGSATAREGYVHQALGVAYFRLGGFAEAGRHFDRALAIWEPLDLPRSVRAHALYGRGAIRMMRGDRDGQDDMRRAKRALPSVNRDLGVPD